MDGLLDNLNGVCPSIKFTMELEEGVSIPFLDTKVTREVEGKLDIAVYRKPMRAHVQVPTLQFSPLHPRQERIGKVSL